MRWDILLAAQNPVFMHTAGLQIVLIDLNSKDIKDDASHAKSTSVPLPMMTYGSTGNYRISFEPSGSGMTTVQLFDLLGKQIFAKTIDKITRPMSFTIPESDMPRTPFVAKVRDNNGTAVRREVPVR